MAKKIGTIVNCEGNARQRYVCSCMEGIRKSRNIAVEIMVALDQIRTRDLYNTKQHNNH